jgi:dolichol-phosphate mannosyltransferase
MVVADVSIVIPTFREHDTLVELLPTLFRVLARAGLAAEVIVVDDDSRDGTEALCEKLAAAHAVRLVTRRDERGLATAVLHGLRAARGNICVVMDADFSHPPEAVPALVAAAKSPDCDMAIGSRYVVGGAVDRNWGWFRRLNSRVASLLARGLTSAADPMAGFFAIRTEQLKRAAAIRPIGYKIALELIVRCDCRRIVEVPISFHDRRIGKSKLSLAQQWLYLRHLARLYAARYSSPGNVARFEAARRVDVSSQRRAA